MVKPTVSVIMPEYNTGLEDLRAAISSIIDQRFRDIELIIINDGSINDVDEIVKQFDDNRIRVISKSNSGVSSARNDGLDIAAGKYILFVDSDDYLVDSSVIERLIDLQTLGCDLTVFEILYDHAHHAATRKTQLFRKEALNEYVSKSIVNEDINSVCNKLYKKSIINSNNIRFNSKISIGEDLLFNLEYVKHCSSIYHLGERLYYYRTSNETSATKRYREDKYEQLMQVNEMAFHTLKGLASVRIMEALRFIRVKNVLSCIIDLHRSECGMDYSDKIALIRHYKMESGDITLRGSGLLPYVIGVVYSVASAKCLYSITGLRRTISGAHRSTIAHKKHPTEQKGRS